MKNILKVLFITAMITPIALNAFGMGLTIPMFTNVEHENDNGRTWKEDSMSGYGLVLDTNIGKNKLYNYRLNIESNEIEAENGYKFDKTSIVNTFGFALFRNEHVRVFMGPRLNIGFEDRREDDSRLEYSLAPAIGVNIHLGSVVSLGLDFDYKISALATSIGDYNDEDLSGITSRFYILFKFGENY